MCLAFAIAHTTLLVLALLAHDLRSVAFMDNVSSTRAEAIDDPVLIGLRTARNRVHHQWARAWYSKAASSPQVTRPITSGSRIVWPPVGIEFCWKQLDSLPAPEEERHRNRKGEQAYRDYLADRPVTDALNKLAELMGD